jgi:hypothetical protein
MESRFLLLAFLVVGTLVVSVRAMDLVNRPSKGVQYETLGFTLTQNLHRDNPFDLETNRVELLIRKPDSTTCVLSFFYNGLNDRGVEQWEARYVPSLAGLHGFTFRINGKEQEQFEIPVEANRRPKQGGLRISDRLGVFQYQTGESFRGIGMNVCWTPDFEYYFRKMHDAGMNVTRIWMCPWSLSFEWKETGLGHYDLQSAHRLDGILDLAKKYGIYIILCVDYHGVAPKGLGFFRENRWLDNPYNKMNGGPCANEADLFTNPDAKRLFKMKYKYIVSRFGHSSQILAWELFNEADLMAGKSMPMNEWHIEMAEYIKSIDVHKHLVSSSSTRQFVEKLVDAFKSPAMDFAMFHEYNMTDVAPHFTYLYEATLEYYQKPVVMGEFGVEFRGGDLTYKADPEHIGLHNGIWAGLFNETPFVPLSWWWDSYIDAKNLWSEYVSLSRFADTLDFDARHLAFKTLSAGISLQDHNNQAPCLVRCIYTGENCALWFKNLDYQWSSPKGGKDLMELSPFVQKIPDLVPGRYTVTWYDPQRGQFTGRPSEIVTNREGEVLLSVPSFSKDLACVITRLH